MGLKGIFGSIGKGIKKLQSSNNPVLQGLKNFGQGMSHANPDAGVGETLAMGAAGVGLGAAGNKLNPEAKPGIHERKPAEQDKEPVIDRAPPPPINPGDTPPIFQNDIEERRKRSAIMRGLRMNQLDTE